MDYGKLPGLKKPVSRLIQGTMMHGDDDAMQKALDEYFALGINTFDTAHVYQGGDNERRVGRWIKARNNRDEIVILAKGAHPMQGRKRVNPADITSDINDSLERFGVDHLDIYLLHRDDPDVPVGEIMDVLNDHLKAGRIGVIGGSNWTHQRIAEANAYAEANGLTPFVASSPNYSLAEQFQPPWDDCLTISGPQAVDARAWYQESQMALLTWSSLAGGFFTGRFTRENLEQMKGEYFDELVLKSYAYEANFQRLDRVNELRTKYDLSVPQMALAYVMNQPLNIFAIVGSKNGAELQANIDAMNLKLTPGELAYLDLRAEAV